MGPPPLRACFRLLISVGMFFLTSVCASSALPETENQSSAPKAFRWIHPKTDPDLWDNILTSFSDELQPDEAKPGLSDLDTYRYKYVQRIGVLNHSALVIIGRRPAKALTEENKWDEYHTAFNFDLMTKQKAPIENAETMWDWKFVKLAKFGPSVIPDVTFTYFSCTECEPDKIFAALRFDEQTGTWKVRSWGDGRDIWWTISSGLVVDFDPAATDTISFDCIYGIRDLAGTGFDSLVMRCKGASYEETDTLKIRDDTVVYGLTNGQFKRRQVTDFSEIAELTAKVCRPNLESLLCKLPGYMTITAGQSAGLDQWFPSVPKTVRKLDCFRELKKTMSMTEAARKCGRPDEVGGSGIAIFIYHLDYGSLVAIGTTGSTGPLLYATHITTSGKTSAILQAE